MSHVVYIATTQRCAQCGGSIPEGPIHTSTRSDIGVVETQCWHEHHCIVCKKKKGKKP